jgi:hypothetical protein
MYIIVSRSATPLPNGTHRPLRASPQPVLHTTIESAKTEATRLARMTPGTEFIIMGVTGSVEMERPAPPPVKIRAGYEVEKA